MDSEEVDRPVTPEGPAVAPEGAPVAPEPQPSQTSSAQETVRTDSRRVAASGPGVSQVFIAPFDGILRTDNLHAAGSVLDITAIVAFVGITILELIVIWAAGIFRPAA